MEGAGGKIVGEEIKGKGLRENGDKGRSCGKDSEGR